MALENIAMHHASHYFIRVNVIIPKLDTSFPLATMYKNESL